MTRKKEQPVIRCAIYTRVSTDERLDQEFNSLHAQREACEAFIESHKHEGWICLPEQYDDGGFTGGNMNRPALQRLLNDVEAGKVDVILVYKLDRFARSLVHFVTMMHTLDEHGVAFVSITQQINTATATGRLLQQILASFAEFERSVVAERTRDKLRQTRARGCYAGGRPVLGYDVHRENGSTRLIINEQEAERVREIYSLYVKSGSLLHVVRTLRERGWCNKQWITKKGQRAGGNAFNKPILRLLLTNPIYLGKIRHNKTEIFEGLHDAIINENLWNQVQARLKENGNGNSAQRQRNSALLSGLLRCRHCQAAMTFTYTKKQNKRYRYYTCTRRQKSGSDICPVKAVPAAEIERFVIDQIRAIGQDPAVLRATLEHVQHEQRTFAESVKSEHRRLIQQRRSLQRRIRELSISENGEQPSEDIIDAHSQMEEVDQQLRELDQRIDHAPSDPPNPNAVEILLHDFEPAWDNLTAEERRQLLGLLIDQIEYDGTPGSESVSIAYKPSGIEVLWNQSNPETSAA